LITKHFILSVVYETSISSVWLWNIDIRVD